MDNPVIEAMTRVAAGGDVQITERALFDRANGMMRAAGPGFFTAGVMVTAEHRLPGENQIRISFANGDALVMPASRRALPLGAVLASARPRRAQMYSISLSGTLDGTGTRWHAGAAEPFLNLHLRQPVSCRHEGPRSVDVMVDVHNLLAQGFRPYMLSDGSVLMFAQDQRSVSGGFAFTF
jgi:hypothetical protein